MTCRKLSNRQSVYILYIHANSTPLFVGSIRPYIYEYAHVHLHKCTYRCTHSYTWIPLFMNGTGFVILQAWSAYRAGFVSCLHRLAPRIPTQSTARFVAMKYCVLNWGFCCKICINRVRSKNTPFDFILKVATFDISKCSSLKMYSRHICQRGRMYAFKYIYLLMNFPESECATDLTRINHSGSDHFSFLQIPPPVFPSPSPPLPFAWFLCTRYHKGPGVSSHSQ